MSIKAAREAMANGNLAMARKHLNNAYTAQPDNPEIRYNLAMVAARQGDFTAASDHFLFCLKMAPDNVELLCNTGNALRLCGRSTQAGKYLDRAVQLSPQHTAARCNRAWLRLRTGNHQGAVQDFRAALDQSKDNEDAWRGLADALTEARLLDEAQVVLDESLKLFPRSSGLHNSQGVLYNKRRLPEQAITHFEQATAQAPTNADAHLNHGVSCEQTGALEAAEKSLLEALRLRPGHASTHFHLAQLASHEASDEERRAIEKALERCPDGRPRVDLLFALAKTLAKQGKHAEAFPRLVEARRLLSSGQPYDIDKAVRQFEKIAAAYQNRGNTAGETRYVFVVGMPRSGTTLTDQILASHSKIHSLGESGAVGKLLAANSGESDKLLYGGLQQLPTAQRSKLASALESNLANSSAAPILVDTSPGNFPYLGLLAELLPNARFVHCSRHPLDTCVSILEHPLSRAHAYANSLQDLGRYYCEYQRLMQHWQSVLGNRLHEVVYEELVQNPEREIRSLLDHCSVDFEDECLHFHATNRPVLTPSAAQVRKPMSNKSVGRWRTYEQFLGPLIAALQPALADLD